MTKSERPGTPPGVKTRGRSGTTRDVWKKPSPFNPEERRKSIVAIASRRACDCLPLFEALSSVDLRQIGTLPISFGCTVCTWRTSNMRTISTICWRCFAWIALYQPPFTSPDRRSDTPNTEQCTIAGSGAAGSQAGRTRCARRADCVVPILMT